ncbi:MAG TPA: AMP-binding protein, partial [Paludibacter sp.]
MYDRLIQSQSENTEFLPLTIKEIIFSPLSHRSENSNVICSHIENRLITITLSTFRKITCTISDKLISLGLKNGDTILLASFSSSNELANALIFAAATCTGIRVFVPMFPEPSEFGNWKKQTDFGCIIMPYRETLQLKGHEREKEVIYTLQKSCNENNIPFLDTQEDLFVFELLLQTISNPNQLDRAKIPQTTITPQTEAVIFTTSGTSGISKLLVYTHQALANCCQAWQQA